jgi:hypothetical protein
MCLNARGRNGDGVGLAVEVYGIRAASRAVNRADDGRADGGSGSGVARSGMARSGMECNDAGSG